MIARIPISIHALRVEGDTSLFAVWFAKINFYPRPPGGGRRFYAFIDSVEFVFLSTPSGWRATSFIVPVLLLIQTISIHALRVEGDQAFPPTWSTASGISIHALRVEGDIVKLLLVFYARAVFLSTPSGWRATSGCWG